MANEVLKQDGLHVYGKDYVPICSMTFVADGVRAERRARWTVGAVRHAAHFYFRQGGEVVQRWHRSQLLH